MTYKGTWIPLLRGLGWIPTGFETGPQVAQTGLDLWSPSLASPSAELISMHITLSLQLIYESKIKFLLKNSLNKTHALTGAPEAHVPRSHQSMLGPSKLERTNTWWRGRKYRKTEQCVRGERGVELEARWRWRERQGWGLHIAIAR